MSAGVVSSRSLMYYVCESSVGGDQDASEPRRSRLSGALTLLLEVKRRSGSQSVGMFWKYAKDLTAIAGAPSNRTAHTDYR